MIRKRSINLIGLAVMLGLILGCSGGGGSDAIIPPVTDMNIGAQCAGNQSQTHLWGYYDMFIDVENRTVEAVLSRSTMFTVNTVNFLNMHPTFMNFTINDFITETEYIDIDIDVTLTHPFPGLTKYNGYDVRAAFMGNGSATMGCQSDLIYPVFGTDQFMFADPADGDKGAPDGYTRWFNISEFADPEMWLFGYTPGGYAPSDFAGTAILCPYKYFADGLEVIDDLRHWMKIHPSQNGQFSSGATNSRNYYLRFPTGTNLKYGYAIIASWMGGEPEYHPANAPEVVACDVDNNSTVYYIDDDNKGGDLIFDIDLYGWGYQPSTIYVESTVMSLPHEFTGDEMVPIGGGANYSTYHVEIPADNMTGDEGNEYWVIAEYEGFDYTNALDVLNDAWDDNLMACFRFDLPIGEHPRVDIYVDGDNDTGVEDGSEDHPYDTIMEAIDAAPTYSLVHVDAKESGEGYYEESVQLKTDVWLHGDNWNGGVGKPRIHVNSGWVDGAIVPHMTGFAVMDVDVYGFELTTNEFEIDWWGGSDNGLFHLIILTNSTNVSIRDCRLGTKVNVFGLTGISLIGGTNITIEHNEFVNLFNTRTYNWSCYTACIAAYAIDYLTIRNNELHHINYQSVHDGGDARHTNTVGIQCNSCSESLEITNNLIYDIYDFSDGDGSQAAGHGGNYYYRHNSIVGISINGSPGAIVANNTLDDFNTVARAGDQAGRLRGIYFGNDAQPPESIVVKNNLVSNMVVTELTSNEMFYGAGFYGAFEATVDYANVYNLDLTNGGAEYYGSAIKGTGSYDNTDMQDPNYGGPGPTFYHVGNPILVSDDGTEMGAFGGPGGNWIPPSQE